MAIDPISFVRQHGVVRVAVRRNWLKHPESRNIFRATRMVRDSDDVLVCTGQKVS
jgi:hypothetical protein